jgi:hypothetical protein
MYLYPWEIEDMETFKKEYAGTECNAVATALSYHHGNTFAAATGRYRHIKEAALSFVPEARHYGLIKPLVHEEVAAKGTVRELRDWAGKRGVRFSGWTVLFHNSSQGGLDQELTTENLFGDHYVHALCPANRDVREYEKALLSDIAYQFAPDSVMLESVTPLPAMHGMHHEMSNVRISPVLRWFLSLCFCPACMEYAAGFFPCLDPDALRVRLKKAVLGLANSEHHIPSNGDAQIIQMLLEIPGLYEYQKARQQNTGECIRLASETLGEKGVSMILIPSATPFDINRVFMEAMSFTGNMGTADLLLPLVYGPGETYRAVLNTVRLFDTETPVGMAASLNPAQYPDRGSFLSTLAAAHAEGCEHFYIYNFSLASRERRGWITLFNQECNT